ncbi:MAG: hypothetical protein JEZ04_07645 [Spirochaetales bacterium]|nr:hypothetical protein [Spirochaetales bacterium]
MKKRLLIVLLIFLCSGFVFSEAPESADLTGVWKTEPFVTELADGQLVAPEATYAFPYQGISEIRILDSGFIIFQLGAYEFRAFYEPRQLDFDNMHLICSFKNGEELVLKLVRAGGGWKYLLRVPSGSVMAEELTGKELLDESPETEMEIEMEMGGKQPDAEISDAETRIESTLYTGIMIVK